MKGPDQVNLKATLKTLTRRYERPTIGNGEMPDKVQPGGVTVMADLFQPRDGINEKHVSELTKAYRNFGDLDPVLVMMIEGEPILIEGHHRLEVYKAERAPTIPVRYFSGPPRDALVRAGEENSKAKLPMDNAERQNFAWRLIQTGVYSKDEVARSAGVSTSQVAKMRRTLGKLSAKQINKVSHSWFKALREVEGEEPSTPRDADWVREAAERFADRMVKTFSTTLAKNPEVTAQAFDIYFGRKLPDLVRILSTETLPDGWNDAEESGLELEIEATAGAEARAARELGWGAYIT